MFYPHRDVFERDDANRTLHRIGLIGLYRDYPGITRTHSQTSDLKQVRTGVCIPKWRVLSLDTSSARLWKSATLYQPGESRELGLRLWGTAGQSSSFASLLLIRAGKLTGFCFTSSPEHG